MKLNTIRTQLAKILAQFNRLTTDKGIISYESDGELPVVDEEIKIIAEDGSETVAEDGEYVLEDKTVIIVAGGKVAEVRLYEVEEVVEDMACKKKKVKAEDTITEEVSDVIEEVVDVIEEAPAPVAEEIAPVVNELEALRARIAELEAENEILKMENEVLKAKPAVEPITEEFKNVNSPAIKGDKKLENVCRILGAK